MPPDFDQILSVKITGHQFTDEELSRGVSVIFQDRNDTAAQRIKENEQRQAIPPKFSEQTSEERKAGF
jgi:hypothetical protein